MSSEKNDINQNFKDRKFMLLLYTDNPEHMRALEHIKKNYDYAAILHNKDEYEEDVYDLIDKNKN